MTVNELIRRGGAYLEEHGAAALGEDKPIAVARQLLSGLLDCSPLSLRLTAHTSVDHLIRERFDAGIRRYTMGEPLAYILGYTWFYGMKIGVGPGVLIPRPDTEVLVERGVNLLASMTDKCKSHVPTVLELCTGTSCVSLALRERWKKPINLVATDVSEEALMYAQYNIAQYSAADDIELYRGDLFEALPHRYNPKQTNEFAGFDLILVNPPYIQTSVIPTLAVGVKDYEPALALDGGSEGISFYHRLWEEADTFLKSSGYLLMEHGYDQKQKLVELFLSDGRWQEVIDFPDLAGRDRILQVRKQI
ncbi:MAG TPA: peptide chain release factor N(5)-glutamine methyltransferase [Clostridiaceae bacterium]|nr:peptide chain release factor N(5)-glutamine methyltransferase [Clostridiaceae bacterium]